VKKTFSKLWIVAVLLVLALIINSCGGTTAAPTTTTTTAPTTTVTSTMTTALPPTTTVPPTTTTTSTPTTSVAPTPTSTSAYLFSLIPHEPGESPKIPHPNNAAYKTCDLCHINPSTPISSIKIDDAHACNECHKLRDSGEAAGYCQETVAINNTCIFEFCHNYP